MEPGVASPPAAPQAAQGQAAQALIAELRWIDRELARLDNARGRLIHRRMVLLAELTSQPAPGQPAPGQPALGQPAQPAPGQLPASAGARIEVSGVAVARALLAVGAVLVIIAAAAFTVANWSSIGPLGRSAVLLGVSAAVLAAARPLARRGLTATAESVAAIGLALTIADAYLIGRFIGAGTSPFGIAAGSAALATAWLCYGGAVRLRAPWLGAIVMAQLPGLYLAAGIAHAAAIPLALCVTAGADLLLAYLASRLAYHLEARTCLLAASATWIAGVGLAALKATTADTVPAACWPAAAFAAAALAGIALWPRVAVVKSSAGPVAAISGFLITGVALPVAVALPAGWPAVALAATGLGLAAVAINFRKSALTDAGVKFDHAAAGSATMLGLTGLAVLPVALGELGGPRYGWPAMIVLALVSLACWLAPVKRRTGARCAGIVVAALSFDSVPGALGATGLARLAILTAGAAALACWAALRTKDTSRAFAGTAIVAATALGTSAALWSAGGHAAAEFAVLTIIFGAATTARNDITAIISTGAALAAATGLAFAAPLAAGWRAGQAAFAAVAVAAIAIIVATLLRKGRPAQALVLDLGAGPIVVLAAIVSVARADTFAVVAVAAAVLASTTSWLRSGSRRSVALAATGCAALAAVGAQWRPLTDPWSAATSPWHGQPLIGTGATAGLPFAVGVLAVGLAAIVTAVGALRGSGRGSLDAVAIALPVVAGPAVVASGLGYSIALGCLLVVAIGLTGWAAFGGSIAPAGGAIVATSLALAWALAAITPTLTVLCCLGTAYLVCAWRCPPVRTVMAGLSALAFQAAWCAGLAALGVTVVEAYTIPAAAIVLAFGWRLASASWPAFGPGLALLLLPSLIATWYGHGWIRPALLGVAAVAVILIGAKQRLQAPLVIGVVVAVTDAGYQFTTARLIELVPGWVPIAICGAVLLWTGATYEARLRNLVSIRRALASWR
ncbi:MAG TPA: hypothetical protein VN695_07815 [Streptosporangiaceae bacterium]|nr:hypothetical protein [Streptosporangiaceae bacterium]